MKSARGAMAELLVAERSFLLVWKVNSSNLRRCKTCGCVTWPLPIYSAPRWTLRRKSRVHIILYICEKPVRDIGITSTDIAIRKVGMGFRTTPKWARQLTLPPFLSVEKLKKIANNCAYNFQMIKLWCFFLIQCKVVRGYVQKTNVKNVSKSMHICTFTMFSVHPSIDAKTLCS